MLAMSLPLQLLFFLAATTSALVLPLHLPNTTTIFLSTNPLTHVLGCAPSSFDHARPLSLACIHAISQLPTSPETGTFHQGGLDDEFRLPVERMVGKPGVAGACLVQIEMRGGSGQAISVERASWAEVVRAAIDLVRRCEWRPPGVALYRLVYRGGLGRWGVGRRF